jgi:hypothetical protein
MGTLINVIVDDGGLSQRARQQAQANRLARVEQDRQQMVEDKATAERQAQEDLMRIAATQKRRQQEPAASRLSTLNFGYVFDQFAEWTTNSYPLYSMDGLHKVDVQFHTRAANGIQRVAVANPTYWGTSNFFSSGLCTWQNFPDSGTVVPSGGEIWRDAERWVYLPAGGRNVVVVHYQTYAQSIQVFSAQLVPNTSPGSSVPWEMTGFSVAQQDALANTRVQCFLIGETTAKQITTPNTLAAALKTLFHEYEVWGQSRSYGCAYGTGSATFYQVDLNRPGYSLQYVPPNTQQVPPPSGGYNIRTWPAENPINLWEFYGSVAETAYSPAIYSLLTDVTQRDTVNGRLYAEVVPRLAYPAKPRNHLWLPIIDYPNDQVWSKEKRCYVNTGPLPADSYDWSSLLANQTYFDQNFRYRSLARALPLVGAAFNQSATVKAFYTDAGIAGYCQQQLLNLGFSQSEITP